MPQGTPNSANRFILVVDDEPDVLRYQAAILEDAGFEVATAGSAEDALEIVTARAPDLISLDLVMPKKSGIRFLHSLRRNREWAVIPVIIVTGHARDNLGRRDLAKIRDEDMISGPQVCLEKPVRPADYVAAVRERLGIAVPRDRSLAAASPTTRGEIDALLSTASPDTVQAVLRVLRGETAGTETVEAPDSLANVLVIDDEPDVAATIAVMLEDGGYNATTLTDSREALAVAHRILPDLITLDLDMPLKSGLTVYGELKADKTLSCVPVVIITGVEEDVESMVRERTDLPNFSGYIHKPVDPDRLLTTASEVLAKPESEGGCAMAEEVGKILIVDDEEDVRSFLRVLFEDNGYAVLTAADGDEGLRLLQAERPDLLTLDLQMPGETGTQMYRRMMRDDELKEIPVIVVSGVPGRHLAVSHPVAVFDKPIDHEKLLETVRDVLSRA